SAGLVRVTSIGMKDVFSHRIMIPIHDEFGEPVGFTARRVAENEEARDFSSDSILAIKYPTIPIA
ncbi:hypothetical protein LI129_20745, partial [Erysipelatoclostridium ramosum]|uniref:hypothetical protein n=1 Tax=Thomasclavelia ramosa TaxID=1547 RepID=UPI001D08EE8B